MRRTSLPSDVREKLEQAEGTDFGRPVTAYLIDAQVVAGCCFAGAYRHARADLWGRFADGHRLRTSDVLAAREQGEFWVLYTRSGSQYVVVSFCEGGRESLDHHFALIERGMHRTPPGLH